MGYTIEVSFDIRVRHDVTEMKKVLREKAFICNCENDYFMHEIEGKGRKMERNHCVFVVSFDVNQLDDILYFLKIIHDEEDIYIECIYRDDGIYNLIHASPIYLQRMEKNFVKQYKKQRKQLNMNNFTKDELRIYSNY